MLNHILGLLNLKPTILFVLFVHTQIRDDVVASMLNSLRRPSRFDIKNHQQITDASRKIVKHFALHVRTLQLHRSDEDESDEHKYTIPDLAFIISTMVNVEEITLKNLKFYGNTKEVAKNTKTIHLPMLKKLILIDGDDEESVNGLLSCVSTSSLEYFYFRGHNKIALDFTQFFKNNRTIKTIVMAKTGKVPNLKAFEHLQLLKLQINFDESSTLDVVSHQPRLKYLNLLPHQEVVHEDLFNVVCSLKDLESLKLAIGQIPPEAIGKFVKLTSLKELVVNATRDEADFNNGNNYDIDKMRSDVNFQKCFRKLIATPLPKLESFTWSLKNCERDKQEEQMKFAHSTLGSVNIIETMAPSFPLLKHLRIEMRMNDESDSINIRDALKRFCYLETLQLKTGSTFKGGPISMHERIKNVQIYEIEENFLIEMLRSMPNLESLKVRNTQFSLDEMFLKSLQAAIPDRLKKLKLNFNSSRHRDFTVENVVILQNIIKKLKIVKLKLTGSCNFNLLAEKIDRSIGVSLPKLPKWFLPGAYRESCMQLWK